MHLKCYTASEIHHMTTLSGLTHEEVLRELKDAGLGSLPGGGAEVFADRVRRLVAPGKESPEIWFHVHDTAHSLGIPTHCTMLYGHVETYEERVDHSSGFASSRTGPAASSHSSRSRSIPRTRSSSGAAGATPPAPTT